MTRFIYANLAAIALIATAAQSASAQARPPAPQIAAEVQAFHRHRFPEPFWTPGAAQALIHRLETSGVDGLTPAAYRTDELRTLVAATFSGARRDRHAMDVALSQAFVHFAADLARAGDTGVTYVDPAARPRPVRPTVILARARESGSVERFIATLAWMNPIYTRLRQELVSTSDPARRRLLALNLQRARALPRGPARYILVNIPSATLEVREGDRILEQMKVAVGLKHTQTPTMAGMMRYAIQNPSWHIPPDITRDKVAPQVLKQGTAYLRSKRYEVLSGFAHGARIIDPASVNWKAVARGTVEAFVRQKPGPESGLGRIVFKFPNEMGIYLHDTPAKGLFRQDDRLASAGCVRLEDADALSRVLLGKPVDRNTAETDKYVPLTRPVPVYLSYLTVFPVGSDIVEQKDIYDKDSALLAERTGGFR